MRSLANMTEVMEAVFGDIEGQLVDRVVARFSKKTADQPEVQA